MFEKVVGRVPELKIPSILEHFHRYKVIDEVYPAIFPTKDGKVEGLIIPDVTQDELFLLDNFEGDDYERIPIVVQNKMTFDYIECYVYVWKGAIAMLYDTWNYENDFLPNEQNFINGYPYFLNEF